MKINLSESGAESVVFYFSTEKLKRRIWKFQKSFLSRRMPQVALSASFYQVCGIHFTCFTALILVKFTRSWRSKKGSVHHVVPGGADSSAVPQTLAVAISSSEPRSKDLRVFLYIFALPVSGRGKSCSTDLKLGGVAQCESQLTISQSIMFGWPKEDWDSNPRSLDSEPPPPLHGAQPWHAYRVSGRQHFWHQWFCYQLNPEHMNHEKDVQNHAPKGLTAGISPTLPNHRGSRECFTKFMYVCVCVCVCVCVYVCVSFAELL